MNWLRLLKNLPLRFNEERSDQLASRHPDGFWRLYLSPSEFLICPDDALVVAIWRFHFFSRGGRQELKDFLQISLGCGSLLDLGASAGIFSALFANTRTKAKVLSIEPDTKSFELLQQTAERNQSMSPDWRSLRAVVAGKPGRVPFKSTSLGGSIVKAGEGEEIEAQNLEGIGDAHFVPEVIKLDIESYEYEVLMGALDWLKTHRPKLFMELHWDLLLERGLEPQSLLGSLVGIGYSCRQHPDLTRLSRRHLDRSGVVRLALA